MAQRTYSIGQVVQPGQNNFLYDTFDAAPRRGMDRSVRLMAPMEPGETARCLSADGHCLTSESRDGQVVWVVTS